MNIKIKPFEVGMCALCVSRWEKVRLHGACKCTQLSTGSMKSQMNEQFGKKMGTPNKSSFVCRWATASNCQNNTSKATGPHLLLLCCVLCIVCDLAVPHKGETSKINTTDVKDVEIGFIHLTNVQYCRL